MPQTRTISTAKAIWRRRETGKKTTAKWAADHPAAVYRDFEHVEREETFS
jgi:hypothetical protein